MKLLLLVVCSVIAIAQCHAGPFGTDEEVKVGHVLNELQEIIEVNNMHDQPVLTREMGDIPTTSPVNRKTNTVSRGVEEVLLHATDIEAATAEVKAVGGRVTLQFGHNLLVAQFPGDFAATQTNFASASAHIPGSASEATLNHAEAYWKFRGDKLRPQPKVQSWTEKTPPKAFPQPSGHLGYGANSPYRQTMTGKIAVGILIASGPDDSLDISSSESQTIESEVIAGLDFWIKNAPASAELSFALYKGVAVISASNPTFCSSYAACHNVFANPTLQHFGYSTGQIGKDQLAGAIKTHAGADGAYFGFFSKYRQSHFAYAYPGGGPFYMQYSNDGWGPDQIDRVFAHETGHVFNAPDEYTSCNCSYNYGNGTCTAKNTNCYSCTSSQSTCIMDSNDLDHICSYSKKHVGWC